MSRESFINRDKKYNSASHKRSRKQEKLLASRIKGRMIPGSGSGYQKGDVTNGVVRIEAKTTKHNSFRVTMDMIRKIEDAALPNGDVPVLVIEFIDAQGNPLQEVAVMPTAFLDEIFNI